MEFTEDPTRLEEALSILKQSQASYQPTIRMFGRYFLIFRNVFSPAFFGSTQVFTEQLDLTDVSTFLEIGCGAGITAVMAAHKGCTVTAVDINPDAVRNTMENAKHHKVEDTVTVLVSDVFSSVTGTFDLIFWNMPFLFKSHRIVLHRSISDLERSVCDLEYRSLHAFFRDCFLYVREGGRVVIGFADVATAALQLLAEQNGRRIQELSRHKHPGGLDLSYLLLRVI